MTTDTTTGPAATGRTTPWHLWLVGGLAVLWNGFGGYDYTMSHLQGAAYYRQVGMSERVIALMDAYPTWMHAVWALGVWGSVAGSVLLLLRSRWALHAFLLSLLGALGNLIHTAVLPEFRQELGVVMPTVILVICGLLAFYASAMTKRGVLR